MSNRPSSKSGPLPPRKIKGLTEGQTLALLWCGTRWRRVRGEFNTKLFRGRGLGPYVEWHARDITRGFRFTVRLTDEGVSLLAAYGVTDPPYFGADFEPRSQPASDSDRNPEGEKPQDTTMKGPDHA